MKLPSYQEELQTTVGTVPAAHVFWRDAAGRWQVRQWIWPDAAAIAEAQAVADLFGTCVIMSHVPVPRLSLRTTTEASKIGRAAIGQAWDP